jgi:hypothetical protein
MASEHNLIQYRNFQRAQQDEDILKERYNQACQEAAGFDKLDLLKAFRNFIEQNKAVCINMKPEALLNLLSHEKLRYINIHNNLDAGVVDDYDSEKYERRRRVDEFLFGADYKEFVHAALNVGNSGLISYGQCCVVWHSEHVWEKTSFLEDNSFRYYVEMPPYMKIPDGSTSLWDMTAELGIVKHVQDICDLDAFDHRKS